MQIWMDLIHYSTRDDTHRANQDLAHSDMAAELRIDAYSPIAPLRSPWTINILPSSSFKCASWNIGSSMQTGMTLDQKTDIIMRFFHTGGMSCLYLLDIRQSKSALQSLRRALLARYPGIGVHIFPTEVPAQKGVKRPPTVMGGTIAIISKEWKHAVVSAKTDWSLDPHQNQVQSGIGHPRHQGHLLHNHRGIHSTAGRL